MHAVITHGTLEEKLFVGIATFVTFRVVFSFLNDSEWVWVTVKSTSTSKLNIWVLSNYTFRMIRIATIFTIIKPML